MKRTMTVEIGFVIVAHGRLGEELLRVATHIMGDKLGLIRTVGVPFMTEAGGDGFTSFAQRRRRIGEQLRQAIDLVDSGGGVIVLTDIVGGTAFNVSREILRPGEGAVVSGVNLPMLLKLPSVRLQSGADPIAEAVYQLVGRSRQGIAFRLSPGE